MRTTFNTYNLVYSPYFLERERRGATSCAKSYTFILQFRVDKPQIFGNQSYGDRKPAAFFLREVPRPVGQAQSGQRKATPHAQTGFNLFSGKPRRTRRQAQSDQREASPHVQTGFNLVSGKPRRMRRQLQSGQREATPHVQTASICSAGSLAARADRLKITFTSATERINYMFNLKY